MSSDRILKNLLRFNDLKGDVTRMTQEIAKSVNPDKAAAPDATTAEQDRAREASLVVKKLESVCETLNAVSDLNLELFELAPKREVHLPGPGNTFGFINRYDTVNPLDTINNFVCYKTPCFTDSPSPPNSVPSSPNVRGVDSLNVHRAIGGLNLVNGVSGHIPDGKSPNALNALNRANAGNRTDQDNPYDSANGSSIAHNFNPARNTANGIHASLGPRTLNTAFGKVINSGFRNPASTMSTFPTGKFHLPFAFPRQHSTHLNTVNNPTANPQPSNGAGSICNAQQRPVAVTPSQPGGATSPTNPNPPTPAWTAYANHMNTAYAPNMMPMSAAGLGTDTTSPNQATAAGASGTSINARSGGGVEYISGHECVVKGPNGAYVVLKCPQCGGNGKFKGTDWVFLQGPKGFQEHLRLVHNMAPAQPRGRRPRGWAFVFGHCIVRQAQPQDLDSNHPGFAIERVVVQSRSDALAASSTTATLAPAAIAGPRGRKRRPTTQGPLNADEDEDDNEASMDDDGEDADEPGMTELEKILRHAKKRAKHIVAAGGPNAAMLGDGSLSYLERAVQVYHSRKAGTKEGALAGVEETGDEGAAGEADDNASQH